MLYNVVLVSAVQQCESAIHIHISYPSRISLLLRAPHPTPLGHHRADFYGHTGHCFESTITSSLKEELESSDGVIALV